jgi:hypothetical protein
VDEAGDGQAMRNTQKGKNTLVELFLFSPKDVVGLCGLANSFVDSSKGQTYFCAHLKTYRSTTCPISLNPWITEQKKLPTFTELSKFCTHIFKIIFATFFRGQINRRN